MAQTLRKFGVILAVAVLFSIFVFALADAFIPSEHDYQSVCVESQNNYDKYACPRSVENNCSELDVPSQEAKDACPGTLNPDYRQGCPTEYICNCSELTEQYQEQDDSLRFWIAIVLGFIAVVVGLLLPSKQELNEWVGAGAMLGGLITIFIATAMYWEHIDKIARPIVIALELVLVLVLAYRKFSTKGKKK